jgi:hypothetical protein
MINPKTVDKVLNAISEIVTSDFEGATYKEVSKIIRERAEEIDCLGELEEFATWFQEE